MILGIVSIIVEARDLDAAITARKRGVGRYDVLKECVFGQALTRHGIAFFGCSGSGFSRNPERQWHTVVPEAHVLVDAFDGCLRSDSDCAAVRKLLPLTLTWPETTRPDPEP